MRHSLWRRPLQAAPCVSGAFFVAQQADSQRAAENLPERTLHGGGRECAWQELNLLPFGPEPNALSGELQARIGSSV
jgi:hypothetical protein